MATKEEKEPEIIDLEIPNIEDDPIDENAENLADLMKESGKKFSEKE